jgi:hypothetical protein
VQESFNQTPCFPPFLRAQRENPESGSSNTQGWANPDEFFFLRKGLRPAFIESDFANELQQTHQHEHLSMQLPSDQGIKITCRTALYRRVADT